MDDHPEETYLAAAELIEELGILYIHIAEADWDDAPKMPLRFKKALRRAFSGTMMYAGNYTKRKARKAISAGWADMIGFGRPFIANPDLPYRLKHDLPLEEGDPDTYFGGGAEGYTDYPEWSRSPLNPNC